MKTILNDEQENYIIFLMLTMLECCGSEWFLANMLGCVLCAVANDKRDPSLSCYVICNKHKDAFENTTK